MNPQNNNILRPSEHLLKSGRNADKILSSSDIPVCSEVLSNETMSFCLGTKVSPWGAFSAMDVRSKAIINSCRCI